MKKRDFLKLSLTSGAAVAFMPQMTLAAFQNTPTEFTLPSLAYNYQDLEPYVDALTMETHHSKHHAAYVNNLNKALSADWQNMSIEQICQKIQPDTAAPIRNNGGGHFNHSFFWSILKKPVANQENKIPDGKMLQHLQSTFGSLDNFMTTFKTQALSVFGSGWAWLLWQPQSQTLTLSTTPNQDNPLMQNVVKNAGIPLLALDVWEHAYYLKYQNKRTDYIDAFWKIIHWEQVEKNYTTAINQK